MKKIFTLLFLGIFTATISQGQIATFNFFTGAASAPATATASSTDPNIATPVILSRGSGAAASSATNSFRTTGFQNNGINVANTDYFEFSVTANAGFTQAPSGITGTFAGTATFAASPGVTQNFAYSIAGGPFTFVNSDVVAIGSPQTNAFPFSAATISALSGLASGTTITFRYYASGQTGTGGWGLISATATTNNLVLEGTTVLPISIGLLNASKLGSSGSKLNWTMGCTSSTLTYDVERSSNGITFSKIFGETVSQKRCDFPFDFNDNQALKGTNFYRIKTTDIDGRVKYSQIASVQLGTNISFEVNPTITSGIVNIVLNAEQRGKVTINVIDMAGKKVSSLQATTQVGVNRNQLDLSTFATGQYYINVIDQNGNSTAQPVIKQ